MSASAVLAAIDGSATTGPVHDYGAVVIGAGPAGLACAATLGGRGVETIVLERSDAVGTSWRQRYDGLRLNTNRWLSRLPGHPFPRGVGMFPSRQEVVDYLEGYARHHRLDVRPRTDVLRIERVNDGWRIRCADAEFRSARVVIATGWECVPHLPDWPGRETFAGELIHAAEYRNPGPYRGRDVLVIGPGCTGMEIAFQVARAGAARVRLAVRTPPHMALRRWGIPNDVLGVLGQREPWQLSDPQARLVRRVSIGDLSAFGLPEPPEGLFERFGRRRNAPTTVDREVIEAIRQRQIEIIPAVVGFDPRAVRLADGSTIETDAVIAATGFHRGLESLVAHLGVLGPDGAPLVWGARAHPRAPGLYFIGFDPRIAGTFRQIRIEARRLARVA